MYEVFTAVHMQMQIGVKTALYCSLMLFLKYQKNMVF